MMPLNNYFSKCPLCSSSYLRRVYEFDEFSVMRCSDCNNSWRSNMYDREQIAQIYCGKAYAENSYFSYDHAAVDRSSRTRFKNYHHALTYLESITTVGKLLDVGCGSGAFLSIARQSGWDLHGVEMSPVLSQLCQRTLGISVTTGRFEELSLPSDSYDVVAMWDIIEHVIDPVSCIQKVKALLRPGGIAVFCTPDEDSLLARTGSILYKLTGSYYSYPAFALHPPYHTYFFSQRGFTRLLEANRLNIIKSYSQEAFFEHSTLASGTQKFGIALIEKIGSFFDSCYETVVFARA
jgi:2-polyprenyl-3-methyl-5-hydroxy-6-metoxy-1,4-benzoquinol methylase